MPCCVYLDTKTFEERNPAGNRRRNWKMVIHLLSEELQFMCGGELILDPNSEYHGILKTNCHMTCEKFIEATYFQSRKFDPVCVTCGGIEESS